MSDSSFPPDRPSVDPLGRRLDMLRAETERVPVPAARFVRRRGDRRSAIQVAGTTLAAASAIGIGSFVLPFAGPDDRGPAAPTNPATAPTPYPVPSLTEDVLLGVTDLDALAEFVDYDLGWAQIDSDDPAGLTGPGICQGPMPPQSEQELSRLFMSADAPGGVPVGAPYDAASSVTVFADVPTAQLALDRVQERMLACEQATGGNSRATALWTLDGVGELGFVVEVLTQETPDGGFGGFHHIAVVRTGPVVVQIWLDHNVPDAPALKPALDLLEVAVGRACEAAGTPCGAGPVTAEPTSLEGEPLVDRLLLLADLPTWDGALPWDTVQDVDEQEYGVDCHPLWADLGALSHTKRVFTVSTADPRDAVSATEVMATFPDEATAEGAVAAMRDGMATCKSRSVVADGVTVEMIDPLEFGDSAWAMTIPGGGETPPGRILVGFVRSGSTAALVTVSYSLDSELPGGPFLLTLDLAAAKLAR